MPFQCTLNTKLQAFQYKIIHRLLGTRKMLKLCNITQEDTCIWCQDNTETITHLFVTCPVVGALWDEIREWLNQFLECDINTETIIFGDKDSLVASSITLIVKYYIFLCSLREQRPSLIGVQQSIRMEMLVEKEI